VRDAPSSPAAPWFAGPAPARMDALSFGLYLGAVHEGPPTPAIPLPATRRKRWIYVGIYDPRFVLGVAVADIGIAGNAFVYLGELNRRAPRAWKAVGSPWSAVVGRRHARWHVGDDTIGVTLPDGLAPGRVHGAVGVGVDVARFDLALSRTTDAVTAMTCVAPAGDDARGRWNLTVKDNTLAAKGTVEWGSERFEVSAPATVDVTDAYAPRHTAWRWASLAGQSADGRAVGVNLCEIHNDSERARENVVWLDGVAHPVGAVRFAFDETAHDASPWEIRGDGVDLRFDPSGMRVGHEDLVLIKSRFVQPYGRFRGTLRVGGEAVRIEDVVGVVEDHDALW
jgi:hypothetical protein